MLAALVLPPTEAVNIFPFKLLRAGVFLSFLIARSLCASPEVTRSDNNF